MKEMVLKRMALKGKDKKGFTLVEVIVVLVILAILMAIAVPGLTGYIDKARDQALKADGRNMYAAAQTIAADIGTVNLGTTFATKTQLGNASGDATITGTGNAVSADWIKAISKLTSSGITTGTLYLKINTTNNVVALAYTADPTPLATSKWAYFDTTAKEWTVKIGQTNPIGAAVNGTDKMHP